MVFPLTSGQRSKNKLSAQILTVLRVKSDCRLKERGRQSLE